jgi:hypothetical protein
VFEIGTKVAWTSQAQGTVKRKAGTIRLVIPAGAAASEVVRAAGIEFVPFLPSGLIKDIGEKSKFDRYFVEVPRHHRLTGELIMPAWYTPRVSMVSEIDGAGSEAEPVAPLTGWKTQKAEARVKEKEGAKRSNKFNEASFTQVEKQGRMLELQRRIQFFRSQGVDTRFQEKMLLNMGLGR